MEFDYVIVVTAIAVMKIYFLSILSIIILLYINLQFLLMSNSQLYFTIICG